MIDNEVDVISIPSDGKSIENHFKIVIIFLLGISSGIPFLLLLSTFSIWLMEEGISKTQIGFLAWVTVPYTLKFLIASFFDNIKIPFLSNFLGHRKSWMIICQLGLMFFLIALGKTNPSDNLTNTVIFAFLVGIFSACFDLVFEAYRIEILDDKKLGPGATGSVLGYRVGMLCSGAGAIYLASFYNSWSLAYMIMACCVGLGIVTALIAPEPKRKASYFSFKKINKYNDFVSHSTTNCVNNTIKTNNLKIFNNLFLKNDLKISGNSKALSFYGIITLMQNIMSLFMQKIKFLVLKKSYSVICPVSQVFHEFLIVPVRELVKLNNVLIIILFIVSFKVADTVLHIMTMPFLLEIGFNKLEIANVAKTFGIFTMIIGGIFAGAFLTKKNIYNLLILCAIMQLLASILFVVQAYIGYNLVCLFFTMGIENVTCGMSQVALIAYLSSLCHKSHTAAHYAILSSFASLVRIKFSSLSGIVADSVNWFDFYSIVTLCCIPCIAILFSFKKHFIQLKVRNN